MTTHQDLIDRDRKVTFHASTHLRDFAHGNAPGRVITGGKGINIVDKDGREFIDGFAGLYCVNIGYGRTEVAEAIYKQALELAYYHTYVGHSNEPQIALSEKILELAGPGMSKVYYGLGGSDANETQLKIVRYYNNVLGRPQKKKVISRMRGYHGSGLATGSLTGLKAFHDQFDLPMTGILHTEAPYYYHRAPELEGMSEREFSKHCAAKLEELILAEGPDTVAAFIGEPVLGTGGIVPPPEGYWDEIQTVLSKYDVLLIADEVVCGFGRIGSDFGSHQYGIKPDLITIAKGLTSAYQPLSGVIVGDKVWQVLEHGTGEFGPIGHGWTYSGHALGCAAGLANLEIIEREGLTRNAAETGAYLQQKMQEAFGEHPIVGNVRGVGMLAALEFSPAAAKRAHFDPALKVGARISSAALEENLIARAMPQGDILGFAPPLVATRDDVDEIVARAKRAVDKVADELTKSGDLGDGA
ncbi:aminotransferase class III-fold pyridoxal phosphate-dependent enzyme [Modicisalibacter tunisiensis]|uniref:aminotransferase n=1 Tax=Modicisalibacter tunisiensis TaxID=390637 RepID=UPI000792F221|nr:aminotransferase [Modicisalibacter tunisiensis]KXS38275.1 MAG: L-2,4-diaminobutyrate transaminase [Halomonadaceae bacterium T82-2]MBZ9537366.1 aminotransferase class III-fold pyridoxal phosphate-dependent enzyme [Modicisalibacter tunisiensis]